MRGVKDGLITFHVDRQHPFDLTTLPWVKTTIDSAGLNLNRYWIRLEVKSNLTAVKAIAAYLLPYRPPIDPDKNATTDVTSVTGYAQASALPTLRFAPWRGENLVWQDLGTIWTGKIEQMKVARVNDGVTDSAQALYMISCDGLYAMPLGVDGDPATAAYPNLGSANTFAAGIGEHCLACSSHDFDLPASPKTVQQIVIKGGGLQGDDALRFWYRWDNADRWTRSGPYAHFPIVIEQPGQGKVLHSFFAYKDGSRTAVAPYIEKIVVPAGQWEWEAEGTGEEIEADVASPQAT